MGRGALYDMGIYCINAARYLFQADPVEVFAWNLNSGDERFKEVPEMTTGVMKFRGDRIATLPAASALRTALYSRLSGRRV